MLQAEAGLKQEQQKKKKKDDRKKNFQIDD